MVYSAAIATSELQYFTIGQYAFSDLGYSNEKKKKVGGRCDIAPYQYEEAPLGLSACPVTCPLPA